MADDRIVAYAEYGEHIPLTCRNHPDKRWSTKNIFCIGARTIFYNLHSVVGMGGECNCSVSCLRPLTEDEVLEEMIQKEAV
jgi:hypothetical protein